jgi:hypothetical protein
LIGCGSAKAQRVCARSTARGHYRARRRHKKPATAARTKRIPHQTPTALRPFARPLPSANGVPVLQPRIAAARPLPRGPRPAKRFNPDGVAPPYAGPASVRAGPALRLNHDSTSSPGRPHSIRATLGWRAEALWALGGSHQSAPSPGANPRSKPLSGLLAGVEPDILAT